MQCLYCKKKLGLFASKKYPFCSEPHAVAYNDEQAGLAMRRVMDPLFTQQVPKAPLQVPARGNSEPPVPTAEPVLAARPVPAAKRVEHAAAPVAPAEPAPARVAPSPAPPPEETSAFRPIVVPATYCSFLPQVRPAPASPLAVPGPWFGFESSAAQPLLPERAAGLIEDQECETEEALPAEAAETAETAQTAEPAETAISHRLHPALVQQKPDWIEDQEQPAPDGRATPVSFATPVSRSLPVALPIGAEPPIQEVARPETARFEAIELEVNELATAEPAPAPLAGRLWSAALGPRSSEEREKHTPHLEAVLDPPPLTLRYPYANLALEYRALAHGALERAGLVGDAQSISRWSVTAAPQLDSARQLDSATQAAPRIPEPPRIPELGELFAAALNTTAARLALDATGPWLEPRAAAAPDPRRKVLRDLREAPAKLRVPEPLTATQGPVKRLVKPAMRFPVPPGETAVWKVPQRPPVQAAAVDLRTWVSLVQLPFWRALPEIRLPGQAANGQVRWPAAQAEPSPIKREDARTILEVRSPRLPIPAERRLPHASLVAFTRKVQADRRLRSRPPGLLADTTGFQRVRAASHIQIREPELRKSNSADLPAATARLPWPAAAGISPVVPPAGAPVPLRPAVRTPEWAA